MSKKLLLIICSTLLLYFLVHWYTASRIGQLLGPLSSAAKPVVQTVFIGLGLAYPLGRLANLRLAGRVGDKLIVVGSYWLGAVFYTCLQLVLVDGILLLDRFIGFLPAWIIIYPPVIGGVIIGISLGTVIIGSYNAHNTQIKRFKLPIAKVCPVNPMTIVCVSDMHLGLFVGVNRLHQLVDTIQQLNPDLVVFPGDILDETVGVFEDEQMANELRRLTPRFGVYGCLGSHEYIWGGAEKAIHALSQAGIRVLRDEYTVINDSFLIVGRDDRSRSLFSDPRKELDEIIKDADSSLPLILLDHTPKDLSAGPRCGANLQLFGHTHGGQMFPLNYFTRLAFKVNWGYSKFGQCHTIVSSGFGTWGPPIRIGSKPEVLHITLNFLQ